MKNPTVKELIEILKNTNQDAIVCQLVDIEEDMPIFSSFEICREYLNTEYIDDNGDIQKGDIVALY